MSYAQREYITTFRDPNDAMPEARAQSETATDLPGLLSQLPLFNGLEGDAVRQLACQTTKRFACRGEMIFQRGDIPTGFYCLVHGQVKLACVSMKGAETVMALYRGQESFGEAEMFAERSYPGFAEALEDSVLLHVSAHSVYELIEREPRFARKLLVRISSCAHKLVNALEAYTLQSSKQRMVAYLLEQAKSARSACAALPKVELPTTKQAIASLLNLSPETLSRVLHHLSDEGLILVEGRHITLLDAARLADVE